MKKATPLVLNHLEGVSWHVLEEYPELVRNLIRRQAGIYALYRRDKLYYVGLASNLMGRLNSHLRDRHRGAWDRFAVYLTTSSDHIRELECLALRIVQPAGNVQSGKFAGSQNLLGMLCQQMKERDADRRAAILGGTVRERRQRTKARRAKGSLALAGYSDRSIQLRGHRNEWEYRARLRNDGTIRYGKRIFTSPSAAGRAAVKGPCNGWAFWHYKSKGKWVPLKYLKK